MEVQGSRKDKMKKVKGWKKRGMKKEEREKEGKSWILKLPEMDEENRK